MQKTWDYFTRLILPCLMVATTRVQASSAASPPPRVDAAAAIAINAETGRVLFEKNSRSRRPVASTQKLLTALIVASSGGLERDVEIAREDTERPPSKLYLKEGEIYRRSELLNAMLIKSPNDAAAALARDLSGSEARFAELMNEVAEHLGARDSNFRNASGLPDPEQYSTARDMAIIARAAHFDPVIRAIVGRRSWDFVRSTGEKVKLKNTNRVLSDYEYCTGMKTGYTSAAGNCLVASASGPRGSVIAVILGSSRPKIWTDMERLLDWAREN